MICFSVIITCYNRELCITRAIESVINQTYQSFEIIIVDDGSSDNSISIISTLLSDKVKLIVHPENRGQNAALNTALAAASYPYIAFLDSDDILLPQCLEYYASAFNQHPDIGFAYGRLEGGEKWTLEGDNLYSHALDQGYISCLITLTAKKECLIEIGKFDERYTICQDDDICMRLAQRYKCKHIPHAVARTMGIGDSMTLNRQKLANGWSFFFHNYRADIIKYCGYYTWGKHQYKLAFLYLKAGLYRKFVRYYFISIVLISLSKNRYQTEMKIDYQILPNLLKNKLKKIFLQYAT